MARVAVLGAGIAGLTASYVLKENGYEVYLVEKRRRAGGVIRSTEEDGFLVEHGPATIRASTPFLEDLLERLNLGADVVEASDYAKRRYVVRGGKPIPIPMSPLECATTPLLSTRGKLRLLTEPFRSPRTRSEPESVADFVRRRFGKEAVAYGADPLLTGIYAGDPHRLGVDHVFPTLAELEREHGSLFRGMWHRRKQDTGNSREPRYRIFSFRNGIAQLPTSMAQHLGGSRQLESEVTSLIRKGAEWVVRLRKEDRTSTVQADAVIATLPLHSWNQVEGDLADAVAPLLDVEYPPVATLTLGFRQEDVGHPLDGFGMLIPSAESGYSMLGAIFTSSIFPNQAPSGHVMLSIRVGGTRDPELARLSMMDLRRRVLEDLQTLLEIDGDPVYTHHILWPHAIPQYTVGYDRVLQHLDELEQSHPGLYFAGNYRHGISITDAMESGRRAAETVMERTQVG